MARPRSRTYHSESQQPLFVPESKWRPPWHLPNLEGVKQLAVDVESKDPELMEKGPGFLRQTARVVGFSIAVDDGAWYFPIGHPEDNYHEPDMAIRWLRHLMADKNSSKVFANAMYDVEALSSLGIEVNGPWFDVQVAQALLNEEQPGGYSLDNLAKVWLGDEKDEVLLREAAAAYGFSGDQVKANLWRLPARYVGPYGEHDARLPLSIYELQLPQLMKDELMPVWRLECRVQKVLWEMRKRGVRVDLERVHELDTRWSIDTQVMHEGLVKDGIKDPWSPEQLANFCIRHQLSFMVTDKGNPSFEGSWLEAHDHPVLNQVAQYRALDKMHRDFIKGSILGYQLRGRVHAQYHAIRREGYGTRSGRLSSSHPNMQQIPARDPVYGPILRSLYLPEEGERWACGDYSSQEPRLAVHFAYKLGAPGVNAIVGKYRQEPRTDLHRVTADICGIDRTNAKTINLGIMYWMGIDKLAMQLNVPRYRAEALFDNYNAQVPFMRYAANKAMEVAKRRGYIRTILGRRSRFPEGEFAHKAFNRCIQGSGADMAKKAMCDIYDELKLVPLVQAHDELDYSVSNPDIAKDIGRLMVEAIQLVIPVVVDLHLGDNWAEAKT